MKYLVVVFLLFFCQISRAQQPLNIDAARLLGYPARQLADQNKSENGVQKHTLEYQAIKAEQSHLYVSFEGYASEAEAQKMMAWLNGQNHGMQGWEKATGFGDEAIKDSDGEHFRLVILRKGHHIVRLKINRLTGQSASLQNLLQAASDLITNEK